MPVQQGGASQPAWRGSSLLTPGQQQFAEQLASQTGLDGAVVIAWLYAEENGSAAKNRQASGNHDWLNIGYTDSATYGAADAIWSNPVTAANATAAWLKGKDSIPGYGRASAGVRSILRTAGQPAQDQVSAIQQSGWASSGYPSLPSIYQSFAVSGAGSGTPASLGSSPSYSRGSRPSGDGFGGFLEGVAKDAAGIGVNIVAPGVGSTVIGGIDSAYKSALGGVKDAAGAAKFIGWLFSPVHWLMAFEVLIGSVLAILGIVEFGKSSGGFDVPLSQLGLGAVEKTPLGAGASRAARSAGQGGPSLSKRPGGGTGSQLPRRPSPVQLAARRRRVGA